MKMLLLLLLVATANTTGCSDYSEKPEKPVKTWRVKCWSGGVVIFDGYSISRPAALRGGSFQIEEADTKYKYVSGDCVVECN